MRAHYELVVVFNEFDYNGRACARLSADSVNGPLSLLVNPYSDTTSSDHTAL